MPDRAPESTPGARPDAVLLADGDLPALMCARLIAEEGAPPAILAVAEHDLAAAAIQAQAELLEAPLLGTSLPAHASTLLLAAARDAAAAGATRLVWPIAVDADLDRLTTEADRAVLIARLIALEPELGPAAGAGRFEVQTPLLDLSDAQVAEIAIDLDVPVWRCWWWPVARGEMQADEAAAQAARTLAQRWTDALRQAGWSEDIELASITSR